MRTAEIEEDVEAGNVAGNARQPRPSLSDRAAQRLASGSVFGRPIAGLRAEWRRRVVPNHWSTLFGVVSIACTVVLFVTGIILMFLYSPSSEAVTYDGAYVPLHGVEMSKALSSTLAISLEVNGGLFLRQAHHWAALLLPAALLMQLISTFFTGGFRRPRRTHWVLLFLILIVALIGGWSGYALPDDMLSGTGLRIVEGIVLGIPFIGTWASALLFGGEFPGQIIEHLYPVHVAIVPAALLVLLGIRAYSIWVTQPAQFRGIGRTEQNIVGIPLANAATRAGGLLLLVAGVIAAMAAAVTVDPVWLYGPSSPGDASAGSQPDWYTGFLDGALRLVPPGWEVEWLGRTWTFAILVPLAVVSLFLLLIALYPFIEEWITGDHRDHNLLDRPRSTATRTGVGVAAMVFYAVLWAAGSADVLAAAFATTFEGVIATLQVVVVLGPIVAFSIARRVCLGLQRKDREIALHGYETGRIVRLPGGEYVEAHGRLTEAERWRLVDAESYAPIALRPDARGRLTLARRLRARLSRFFFEDRIAVADDTPAGGTAGEGRVDLSGPLPQRSLTRDGRDEVEPVPAEPTPR